MSSGDEGEVVHVAKMLCNVLSEGVAGATRADTPPTAIVGVTPHQIAHGALMGHLLDAIQRPRVVQRVNAGGESAVEAKNLVGDDSGHREVVKSIGEVLPYVGISVFSQTLVVEAVDLGNLSGFVVATKNCYAVLVPHLEADKEGYCLETVVATVNVVSHKEVVAIRALSSNFE